MKKIVAFLCTSLLSLSIFAQADWGENLKWKEAFYAYAVGTNLSLNENQKMFLIKNDFYKDWQQFHEDEFEWEDHKANDVKAIQDEISSFKNYKEKKCYAVTSAEFGKYDFEKEGYPVDIAEGVYFQLDKPYNSDATYEERKAIPDMALWLVDFSKYNFFPMSKDKAKTFQTERKDRYGDVNRKIILVIHYSIEDFISTKYKGIEKSFEKSGYTPVVANISSIEIYDEKNKKIGDLIQK